MKWLTCFNPRPSAGGRLLTSGNDVVLDRTRSHLAHTVSQVLNSVVRMQREAGVAKGRRGRKDIPSERIYKQPHE